MQLAMLGFCISPLVGKINSIVELDANNMCEPESPETSDCHKFSEDGGINEADYDKASVYSLLYSLYANVGQINSADNQTFEFTFNTWGIAPTGFDEKDLQLQGIAPSGFGEEDPQRHGKSSYGYFVNSPDLQQYVEKLDGKVQIVEIGCGTGGGANHLSEKVFPKSKYMAIDMQKAAIDTCNRLHASDRLECIHIPSGVGNNGGSVPLADGSVDMVIILETHIAEQRIGPEEKAIFQEISRILKPGGYFLWGNAIPTDVWYDVEAYLPTVGYKTIARWNNTKEAVIARDEDAPRVATVLEAIKQHHVAFKLPYFGLSCWEVIAKLLRNFYRDPSTALYDKMVRGTHSYMHYVFQLQ